MTVLKGLVSQNFLVNFCILMIKILHKGLSNDQSEFKISGRRDNLIMFRHGLCLCAFKIDCW